MKRILLVLALLCVLAALAVPVAAAGGEEEIYHTYRVVGPAKVQIGFYTVSKGFISCWEFELKTGQRVKFGVPAYLSVRVDGQPISPSTRSQSRAT